MAEQLTMMAVHAHPDDEATSGGSSMMKYQAEGVRTILVTCTNGEEGEIHDPDLVPEEAKARLGEIRIGELQRAVEKMKIDHLELLGYRDSGMAGTPENEHPENFHMADMHEATGRLVKLVRQYRPQVLLTYNSFGGYGHPDHIKAHKITIAAFDYAANTRKYPEAEFGAPFQPSKLYTVAFARSSWQRAWEMLMEQGREWPFQREGMPKVDKDNPPEFGSPDNEITTIIEVAPFHRTVREALYLHRTQINMESPWVKMREEFTDVTSSREFFILFKSTVPAQRPEYDLFAGIR
jgi:mycothiol conjugate amidase Mca